MIFDHNENFLTKTETQCDLIQLNDSLQYVLQYTNWPLSPSIPHELTTISINLKRTNHTPIEEKWTGVSGRLRALNDGKILVRQQDYIIWNEEVPEYIKKLVGSLEKEHNFQAGRVRFSNLKPMVCLNTHADSEQRFHLAITTNPHVFFYNNTFKEKNTQYSSIDQLHNFSGVGYHIPVDGFFYKSNTLFSHTAVNSGWSDRIHLVVDICSFDHL